MTSCNSSRFSRLDQPKCQISQSSSNSESDTQAIDSLNPAPGSSTFTLQPSLQMQFRKFFRVPAMGGTRAICSLIREWNQRAKKAPPTHRRGGSATAAPPKSRDISTGWGQRMAPPKAPPASWLPFLIYRWPLAPHSLNAVLALALRGQRGTWFLAPHS